MEKLNKTKYPQDILAKGDYDRTIHVDVKENLDPDNIFISPKDKGSSKKMWVKWQLSMYFTWTCWHSKNTKT